MARPESRFICQACGASSARWEGRCHVCGEWGTLVETVIRVEATARLRASVAQATDAPRPEPLASQRVPTEPRAPIGLEEVDRVLGGGLVAGSTVLLGGEPGIGKSTLVLEIAAGVTRSSARPRVLYASGEESGAQVRLRAERLGLLEGAAGERIDLLPETSVDGIIAAAGQALPGLLIVDSIQTMTADGLEGPAGSVGQVREAAARLGTFARATAVPVVLVGHVTK
ncbi:MAG: AAA family ATPase, partial [Chloroflexi bacterium]|nr:AAA family ATPase [Chloroflexota bacterium]